jgi:hypothetical protein
LNIQSLRDLLARELHDFGFWPTMYDLSLRAANHVLPFKIWNAVVVEYPHPAYMRVPETFRAWLLEAHEMRAHIGPQNDLDEETVDEACVKGDKCMAFFDGNTLAAYGWYSSRPTDLDTELQLRFKEGYVYMYKGFTNNRYRGQRLHAIGMTLALAEYRCRGYLGMVSVVSSNNLSSLRSCYRMGYVDFGRIYVLKMRGRYYLHHSSGCRNYEFSLHPKPTAEVREVKTAV